MASSTNTTLPSISQPLTTDTGSGSETDYGSEFSEEELQELNREIDRIYGRTPSITAAVEDNPILQNVEATASDESPSQERARIPRASRKQQKRGDAVRIEFEDNTKVLGRGEGQDTVSYPDLSGPLSQIEPSQIDSQGPEPAETEVEADPIEGRDAESDSRPPILRYRAPPRKALSVTDLVSPAWCELQYSFDLSRHGRKKATPAMKMGTVVHEALEKEVYTTVPVDVKTREEKWGLKIWNVISGLNILAETGMTRELEVWGVIGGELVGGVIDEVSLTCPNPALEEQRRRNDAAKDGNAITKPTPLESGQATLPQFMLTHGGTTLAGAFSTPADQQRPPSTQSNTPMLYITDVKTRKARSVPNDVSARPTKFQLMLYKRLLSAMANREFDFDILAEHYDLDMYAPFGDSFIAQIAALDADLDTLLLNNNTLSRLWSLIPGAFAQVAHANSVFDGGGTLNISPILTAEYRDSTTGSIRGTKTFLYSDKNLDAYIENGMEWWRGERPPRGVEVEEAFKCQICQFAPDCEWRINKVEEAMTKSRARVGGTGAKKGNWTKSGFAPSEVVEQGEQPQSRR